MVSGVICHPFLRWMSLGRTGKSKMWCKIIEPLSRGFLMWLQCQTAGRSDALLIGVFPEFPFPPEIISVLLI